MADFSTVRFKGAFRHYQQKVLDNAEEHLKDNRVHIVAAPGSGKTTLGLELIRYLDAPALVLSPSVAIRSQWGSRFEHGFLERGLNVDEYISYSLLEPKLITSLTYQGLHAAFNKLVDKEDGEDTQEKEIDYSKFDLIKEIKNRRIKTICLDEAHHLRTEWHKTLMKFLKAIESEVTVIALTATPPYDSTPYEWQKYEELCGPIDEEIFVPELIARKNLCPHQDFIYFNYPSKEEKRELKLYQEKASRVTKEIFSSEIFQETIDDFLEDYKNEKYALYEHVEIYITLVQIAKKYDKEIPRKLAKAIKGRRLLEHFDVAYIEAMFEFIMNNEGIFSVEVVEFITSRLKREGLLERKKVNLKNSNKLRKQLVSSVGKLNSIAKIAQFEYERLLNNLQMLVLTDYIKKDMIHIIGSGKESHVMGAVPIFEEIRKSVDSNARIALLSGGLVILPNAVLPDLGNLGKPNVYTVTPLNETDFSVIRFKGNNKQKVQIVTELFEQGCIDILIGTKSLLGEGWDSPSINTLVLASFVGSYMLSNQMRGRAIRTDYRNPNKVSSIWHLATIEATEVIEKNPLKKLVNSLNIEQKDNVIESNDFDTLTRRFKSFLGPTYEGGSITSGIERINIIKPPYDQLGIEYINNQTLAYAENRDLTRMKWETAVSVHLDNEVIDSNDVKKESLAHSILFKDMFLSLISTYFFIHIQVNLIRGLQSAPIYIFFMLLVIFVYFAFASTVLPKIFSNLTASSTLRTLSKSVLMTLKDLRKIEGTDARVVVDKKPKTDWVSVGISNASRHDKALFSTAISEMLSKFDNPRYIIVRYSKLFGKKRYHYNSAFQVPKIIAYKKSNVEAFVDNLEFRSGKFEVIYVRNELGRPHLIKARRRAKVNRFNVQVLSRKVLKQDN